MVVFASYVLVAWTVPQLTLPSLGKMLRFEGYSAPHAYDAALREAEQFADAVVSASNRVGLVLVPVGFCRTTNAGSRL